MTHNKMDQAIALLQNVFGYEQFRPQQADVIEHVLNAGDAVIIMPTGGGKSLCYQIPAMLRKGTGVVISPLIALMQDQVAALQQNGVKAAFLNSSLDPDAARAVEHDLLNGQLDLLYVAPERLVLPRTLNMLANIPLALFAIDEAHCVSQWGHDFRPEYMRLEVLAEHFPRVPRIALTATADANTRDEIKLRLALNRAKTFISGFDRPNIRYHVVGKQNARQQLLQFLRREHQDDAGIVYCLSRNKVEDTARWLQEQGFHALPYHAGLGSDIRARHQNRFLQEEGVIIVATIAFGMGIDKPNVRFVAHLDLPKSVEAYYQETGRAGRDGLAANAWMSYGLQDVVTLRQMLESSTQDDERRRIEHIKLDAMLGFCELTSCRRQALLHYFGDTSPGHCGNCDNCLQPVKTEDATVQAQKVLSCIHRTGQRFGSGHVIDVLLGRQTERVERFQHRRVTTYGIGKEFSAQQWKTLIRQLVAQGYIQVDMEHFGALRLTSQCRPLLRGESTIAMRKEPLKSPASGQANTAAQWRNEEDQTLWEALKKRRMELSRKQNVPPYVIFHDASLKEMVMNKPRTLTDFADITGVGERKLYQYGKAFIEVIKKHSGSMVS